MTALKGKAIDAFVKKRDPSIAAILLYGPDLGLVRERADTLARDVVTDIKDPFNAIELSDQDLKAEPTKLADEAAALSFAGGERLVRIRTAGEPAAKAADILLKGLDKGTLKPNALVIIEAGDLTPRSALRKMFEKAKTAVSLPCYVDGPADVRALANDCARAEGLQFDDDALDLITAMLGEDRGVSRSEIDKLILYKGLKTQRDGPATISLEDVRHVMADGVSDMADAAAASVADGDPKLLTTALYRSQTAGASPITLLRALQRAFTRLHQAQGFMSKGESAAAAMKRLKPPVFFIEQRAFETRLRRWPLKSLERALDLLVDAELDAKTTGSPQREIVERTALKLSLMGARARR